MRKRSMIAVSVMFSVLLTGPAWAQDMFVFPAKGQSDEQMERDKFECYQWAREQTGFDPMKAPQASSPPPQTSSSGSRPVRGAARGAAVGAAGGAIAGDAGKGAAVGAATGALVGGIRRRDQAKQQQQAQQQAAEQQAAEYSQKRGAYDRAYGACLEGKGYTVK